MSYRIAVIILFLLCIVEIFCMKAWLQPEGNEWVSVLYILAGIGISAISVIKVKKIDLQSSRLYFLISSALLLGCLFYGIKLSSTALAKFEITHQIADMIPVIQVMNERFISGSPIYTIIPEIHGGMTPIYLPAMWLPFSVAVIFDFDLRWITVAFILIGSILVYLSEFNQKRNIFSLLWIILLYLLFRLTFVEEDRIITMTEEGVVVGYYLFLVFALQRKNAVLIGLALSLCLLSRYALVFWVPVFLIFLVFENKKRSQLYKEGII